MIVRVYVRISTNMQVTLNIQKDRIRRGLSDDMEIVYYEDVATGKNMRRTGLQKLLEELKDDDMVIVTELSRLTRSTKDGLFLKQLFREKNVPLFCLDTKGNIFDDEHTDHFNEIIALFEREVSLTSQRVKDVMASLKEEGKMRSRPPFGWKFVAKGEPFAVVQEQQNVIRMIFEMTLLGMNFSQIASTLNERGYGKTLSLNKPNPNGKETRFHAETVKRVLNADIEMRLNLKHYGPDSPQREILKSTAMKPSEEEKLAAVKERGMKKYAELNARTDIAEALAYARTDEEREQAMSSKNILITKIGSPAMRSYYSLSQKSSIAAHSATSPNISSNDDSSASRKVATPIMSLPVTPIEQVKMSTPIVSLPGPIPVFPIVNLHGRIPIPPIEQGKTSTLNVSLPGPIPILRIN